jgi:KH domain
VPHSIAVIVEQFEEKHTLIHVTATIYVEPEGQKGIVVGKGGATIKKIGTKARLEGVTRPDDRRGSPQPAGEDLREKKGSRGFGGIARETRPGASQFRPGGRANPCGIIRSRLARKNILANGLVGCMLALARLLEWKS